MQLNVEWSSPFQLKDASADNLIYAVDLEKLPTSAGVYILGRKHGTSIEVLYVGKANNIRIRVRGQFKNLPLMLHLKNARSGKRVMLAAKFIPRPGQQTDKCLALIERALIRHFLSEGHDLVNIQGTRLRRHEITSVGRHPKRWLPKKMFVDKAKGE